MTRGFTLIEGLMVAAVLAVASSVLWQLFSSGMKREQKIDFRTRALQTAALARTRIAADFNQILPSASVSPERATGQAVTFDRAVEGMSGEGGLPIDAKLQPKFEKITYRFDPASHRLLRNGQPVAVGLLKDLAFTFESGRERGYTLVVELVLAPEEEVSSPRPSQVAKFAFSFHSPQGTLKLAHRTWVGDYGL